MKLPRLAFPRRKPAPADPGGETRAASAQGANGDNPPPRPRWKLPGGSGGAWLLLAWDIGGLRAAIAHGDRQRCAISAHAEAREAFFPAALANALEQLRGHGEKIPRRAALAARHFRPAVAELPVHPDKPRPAAQMRELLRGDLEPVLAEFGGLWTMGALLHARHHLSAADRDRVVLEETLRREDRRTPLRYGETALELSLIDRATLNECLELQESLQYLDSELMSAWKGRVDGGEKHWLAGALNARLYRQWSDALARHGLRLDTVLPLAWLCSGGVAGEAGKSGKSGGAGEAGGAQRIALELHAEEVMAVRRRRGLVVAARAEGRMERPLQADWLQRLIEDWSSEARAEIEIVCLDEADEDAAQRAAEDLELTTGYPARVLAAGAAWAALWPALLREAATPAPEHGLPRLALRELRGKPWKNPDLLRVAALVVVVLALAATEGRQRYQLYRLRQNMAETMKKEEDEQKMAQLINRATAGEQQLLRELESSRRALEPLVNERARLEAIASMRHYLPDLMLALAQAVGTDAVLDRMGNSRVGSDATAIRVEAWSTSYTGAQGFVNRVAGQTGPLGYGVAQTEIREERGRADLSGYRVGFWLVQEADELEQVEIPAAPAAGVPPQAKGKP
ncbi:MAG: hypothetical protein LBS49_11575 [Candidatus Accumulibacter sp.]|jgi:hypothetical protein|nr:hypothetical protein [Accumulibacter sp.]